jgi:hypothetical protein
MTTHIQEALHKLRAFTLEAAAQHFLQVDEPQVPARELAALCAGDIRDRSQVLYMCVWGLKLLVYGALSY